MERDEFLNNFSHRLGLSFQNKSADNKNAKTGMNIKGLAKAAGVSYQMARKYTLGMALPDYHVILKIANWLNVSPAWLLFGEEQSSVAMKKSSSLIAIESDLLNYVLRKCMVLFSETSNTERIIQYIVEVIYDASHINTDKKMLQQVIDMMISSATKLNGIKLKASSNQME